MHFILPFIIYGILNVYVVEAVTVDEAVTLNPSDAEIVELETPMSVDQLALFVKD